jgi:hydrogenase-4 component B
MTIDPASALPLLLAGRMALIGLTLALSRRRGIARRAAFGGAAVLSTLGGILAVAILRGAPAAEGTLLVHPASGVALSFTLDGLAAWFLLVLSLLAAPIAIFSIGYTARSPLEGRSVFLSVGFNVLVGAVELVFVSAGVIAFLFAWELMTLSTAALVSTEHESRVNRRAAYLYLVMSHVATGCLIAGFMLFASHVGSLDFRAFAGAATNVPDGIRHAVFALFLVGFGTKAGMIPLHVWLPEAHPAAPTTISALMSAVLIKTGIYGLVRFCTFGIGTPRLSWGVVVLVLGGTAAVLGVLYALMQHDLKRLLAYHSIENVGIILLGLGSGMIALAYDQKALAAVGITAALYHTLNHAVFKGLLFLGAGGVAAATGTRQIEELGGLLPRVPWTALFFLVAAAAISGLPPLNGFVSEWLVFQSLLYGFHLLKEPTVQLAFIASAALLALTTALAAACFVKAFGITFLARPRSDAAEKATESPRVMLLPQAALAGLCVLLGLLPGLVLGALRRVMTDTLGGDGPPEMARSLATVTPSATRFDQVSPIALALVVGAGLALAVLIGRRALGRRVRLTPTWACGGELNSRTEYTATAFSKPLMMIFRAVYRPTREVEAMSEESPYFPREVRFRAEIEPTFERFLYGPLTRSVLGSARTLRHLQAGSLHAYLAYVIVLVLGLVLFVWWRG